MKLKLTSPPQETMFSSVAIQFRRPGTHYMNGDLPVLRDP